MTSVSYQAGCDSDGYLTLATYLNDEDCSGSYAHVTTFGLSDTDYCLTADSCTNTDDPTPEPTFYSMTPSPTFTTGEPTLNPTEDPTEIPTLSPSTTLSHSTTDESTDESIDDPDDEEFDGALEMT